MQTEHFFCIFSLNYKDTWPFSKATTLDFFYFTLLCHFFVIFQHIKNEKEVL